MPYQNYFFIAVVVAGLAVAVVVGFLIYRNSRRRPTYTMDRTDCFPLNPLNDDTPNNIPGPNIVRPKNRD